MHITFTCETIKGSIADKLEQRLGHIPRNSELVAEVKRILANKPILSPEAEQRASAAFDALRKALD